MDGVAEDEVLVHLQVQRRLVAAKMSLVKLVIVVFILILLAVLAATAAALACRCRLQPQKG